MQFGANINFTFGDFLSFEETLDVLEDIGYEQVEPFLSPGHDVLAEYNYYHMVSLDEDPREYGEKMDARGLDCQSFSSHAPLMKPEAAVKWLRQGIRWANDLDAQVINTAEGPQPDWMDREQAFNTMQYTLQRVLPTAERYGIDVCMEPEFDYTQNPETMLEILDLVDSDRLRINLDTGNIVFGGYDPVEYLKTVGPENVGHVHIKDVDEDGNPVAMGDGVVDYDAVFDILRNDGYDGIVNIEHPDEETTRRGYEHVQEHYPFLLE